MDESTSAVPPGGGPSDPQPARRYDWERTILWADIPKRLKSVALAMATFANPDGSNVRPGLAIIADAFDDSERWTGQCVDALVELGLLILVRKGGPSRDPDRPGRTSLYQLSTPGDALAMRLDPEFQRLIPRAKKAAPKARPVSRKKTDQTPAALPPAAEHAAEANPASGRHRRATALDPNCASSRTPVDNPADPNSTSPRRLVENPAEANCTSGEVGHRPEAQCTPTRSTVHTEAKPTSHYQVLDQPQTRTTRVVTPGGERHLSLVPDLGDEGEFDQGFGFAPELHEPSEPPDELRGEPRSLAPQAPDQDEGDAPPNTASDIPGPLDGAEPTATPHAPTVTAEQYEAAFQCLVVLDDVGASLIARAAAAYAAEGFANVAPMVLAVRAAAMLEQARARSA